MDGFEPVELIGPDGQPIRIASSYDTMLYDTVRIGPATMAAGELANLFGGDLDGFTRKTGADVTNLVNKAQLPKGAIALVHRIGIGCDVSRPLATPGAVETLCADVLAIVRETFISLDTNGQNARRLGRSQFFPPWWTAMLALGAQATGGLIQLAGEAVTFKAPIPLGNWGASQFGIVVTAARDVTFENSGESYDLTAAAHVTVYNPVNRGDGD